MLKRSIILGFFLISIGSFCQVDENYDGIYSKGTIPEIITNPTYQTYEDSYESGKEVTDTRKEQNIKKDFVLSSSYYINDLLVSGDVVFGHEVSAYLNQIKNKLIKDRTLSDEIQVYLIKSSAVNAFATHEGLIVVSTGLMERLDNEAQLAYIISHEISHVVKKHGINAHVEEKIQEKTDKEYRKKTNLEKYLLVSSRSREHEFEADEYGFNFFKNTEYDAGAPKEVFEILKRSYLPYRTESKINNFFSSTIHEKLGKSTDFSEEIVDSLERKMMELLSSHPVLDERIARANNYTKDLTGQKKFILSESSFEKAQEMSKLETLNQLINDHLYEQAIYSAFLLNEKYGDNKYYNKLKLRLFYEMWSLGIAKVSSDFTNDYGIDMSKATQEDLKTMLVDVRDNYKEQWPNDIYLEQINKQLDGTLSSMKKQFESFSHIGQGDDARDEFLKKCWKSSKGKRIDKVLVIDPQWVFMDNKVGQHFVRSEVQAERFTDIAKVNAEKAKLEVEVLSYNYLVDSDVRKYNELNLLRDYNSFILENEGQLIYPGIEQVQQISKKYGTNNLVFLGCYTNQFKKSIGVKLFFGGISLLPALISPYLVPVYAPAIMTKVLVPEYDTYLLFQLYDTENISVKFVDAATIDKKSSKTLLNYQFYNYFRLIRGRK